MESTVVAALVSNKGCDTFVHGDNKGYGSSSDPPRTSFLDIVDMSQHVCCGFSYIFCLVDPVSCHGHVSLLRSTSNNELVSAFLKLMELSQFPPTVLCYDTKFNCLQEVFSVILSSHLYL